MEAGFFKRKYLNIFSNIRIQKYIYLTLGWVIAANLFVLIKAWGIEDTTGYLILTKPKSLAGIHIEATMMGFCLGLILAWVDQLRFRIFGRKKIFGVVIIIKAAIYIATIVFTVTVVAFIFLLILGAGLSEATGRIASFVLSTYFLTIIIYGAVISFLFSFIKQVDSKFGPGNLFNIIIGKYHKPKIEDRIFLFVDLKNSTGLAEKLGHIRFSQLLQDCFYDITPFMKKFQGQIYQYVGDEIVVTWNSRSGLKNLNCIQLYFSFSEKLQRQSNYYLIRYGIVPEFTAGMNCGHVTVAEVGVIKREIAYHGDTINTASRIQHQCSNYGKRLLISGQLYKRIGNFNHYITEYVDTVSLKGKKHPVALYSIEN